MNSGGAAFDKRLFSLPTCWPGRAQVFGASVSGFRDFGAWEKRVWGFGVWDLGFRVLGLRGLGLLGFGFGV